MISRRLLHPEALGEPGSESLGPSSLLQPTASGRFTFTREKSHLSDSWLIGDLCMIVQHFQPVESLRE